MRKYVWFCFPLLFYIASTAASAQTGRYGPSGFFSYVAPYVENGKNHVGHPMVTAPEQMTTAFPKSNHIDGVVLLLYWSLLNPERGQYSFDELDKALAYWKSKGKHVGLNVATVGWPVRMSQRFGGEIMNATPEWVMRSVTSFRNVTRIFDYHEIIENQQWDFPLYWDEAFVGHVSTFMAELGRRYGNNPMVSFVRIASGVMGEDQPSTSRKLDTGIPDFTPERWLNYTTRMIAIHRRAFPKKPLEFDLIRTSWFLTRGTPKHKALVQDFVRFAAKNDVVFGYNGIRDEAYDNLSNPKYHDYHMFSLLSSYTQTYGIPVTLEAYGPPQGLPMKDTDKLYKLVATVRPIRVNFFGQMGPVLNMAENKVDPATDELALRYFELRWKGDSANQAQRNLEMIRRMRGVLWKQ